MTGRACRDGLRRPTRDLEPGVYRAAAVRHGAAGRGQRRTASVRCRPLLDLCCAASPCRSPSSPSGIESNRDHARTLAALDPDGPSRSVGGRPMVSSNCSLSERRSPTVAFSPRPWRAHCVSAPSSRGRPDRWLYPALLVQLGAGVVVATAGPMSQVGRFAVLAPPDRLRRRAATACSGATGRSNWPPSFWSPRAGGVAGAVVDQGRPAVRFIRCRGGIGLSDRGVAKGDLTDVA